MSYGQGHPAKQQEIGANCSYATFVIPQRWTDLVWKFGHVIMPSPRIFFIFGTKLLFAIGVPRRAKAGKQTGQGDSKYVQTNKESHNGSLGATIKNWDYLAEMFQTYSHISYVSVASFRFNRVWLPWCKASLARNHVSQQMNGLLAQNSMPQRRLIMWTTTCPCQQLCRRMLTNRTCTSDAILPASWWQHCDSMMNKGAARSFIPRSAWSQVILTFWMIRFGQWRIDFTYFLSLFFCFLFLSLFSFPFFAGFMLLIFPFFSMSLPFCFFNRFSFPVTFLKVTRKTTRKKCPKQPMSL